MNISDIGFMRNCLELAARAEGRTSPNPLVGSIVLSQSGEVVGSGYHEAAGQPHAEVNALEQAGEKARDGCLYVSLEPCCHHGRTPPCTERIIASGVSRVVYAVQDPNPKVAGRGAEILRAAGIEVVSDVLSAEASWLNRAFFNNVRKGLPWVSLKLASTLDGKIADRNGKSQWITGTQARVLVHDLRNRNDCILIGAGTARADNPSLNVRDIEESRDPKRAVIDPSLTVAPDSRLCDKGTGGDTILFCSRGALAERQHLYPDHVSLVEIEESASGGSLSLSACLKHLANLDVLSVLCEGGGRLAGALLNEDLVDELFWFCAPKIIGDKQAVCSVDRNLPLSISETASWRIIELRQVGADALIHCTKPASLMQFEQ